MSQLAREEIGRAPTLPPGTVVGADLEAASEPVVDDGAPVIHRGGFKLTSMLDAQLRARSRRRPIGG